MRPSLRKALVAAAAVVAVAASGQQAEAEGVQQAGGGLEAVADLLHPQDWLNDKQMRAPPADAAPRFREEENAAAAAAASGSGSASSGSDDSGSDDSGSDDSASGSDASDDSGSDASGDSGSDASDDSASGSSGSDDSASGSSGSDDSASGSSGSEEAGGSSSDDSSSSSDADGVMSSFSQEGTGAASGDVGSASSSSGSGAGGDEAPSSSSSGSVVDAEKTLPTRGPLGRRTQDNRGAVTYANGKRMVVPVIAETNSDKPVGVVPPQVTSEKPARVVSTGPAEDAHGCVSGSEDAACQPARYSHVPSTVDQLQALPSSVASTQHVGLDDKASAAKRALEEGKFAAHPDNFNLENALEHPERLLSVHPPVPETTEQLVREARAEVLGKVSSKADRDALAKLGVNVDRVAAAGSAAAAGQPTGAAAAAAGDEAEDRQKALLGQQREAEAESRGPVRKVEKALHQELAEQLRGFERDRKALRMQIGDTKRALAELSMPDGATPLPGLDPHLSLEGDLGQIDDPADPVTGLPNPALKELTAGQRHRRVQAAVDALRDELAARRQARAGKGAPKQNKAERELADVARAAAPAGSPLALRRDGERERREEARRHPLATAVRQRVSGDAAKVDSDQLDASLTGLGRKGAAQLKAAGSGVPGARPALVDELAQLAVKRLETPESEAQQTNTLELEMELVALDLKKALEKQEGKEEARKERVSGTELAEDEELHRLVTKLADLHHMHKSLGGKAKQQMLAEIANTIVAIKQLYPNPTTLVEGQARVQARAAAEARAGLPPMNPRTHFEPAYVDSLCASHCGEARQTCQSACTEPACHTQCAQAHAQCCPQANPSLVAVSSASSAASSEHVRATPECFARFQECSSNHTQCASQCQEQQPCHEQCAKAHQECRSPCKVEADEVVRDACGRCHLVASKNQDACQRQECKAAPVTVATDANGVARVDQEQPAAHDGKEHLPSSLSEQLLATFLKDQMKFNRGVMKQLQELKEAKGATAPAAKTKLDAAEAPKPPAAEEADAVQKKDEVVREREDKEKEEKKEEEKADAKLDHMLRFAAERVGDSVPAVHTVPVPKVHAHHTRPMPTLAHRARHSADGVVSHLEDMLSEIKDDTA